jgi:hypothetical protein
VHEVGIAGAIGRLDLDFGFGDFSGIGHGRQHRHQACPQAQRAELASLPFKGTWWGLVPAVMGVLFFWLGYKVDTGYLGFASVQLMTAALILLLGGPAWMRALLMPWLFLVFAWPMLPLESIVAAPLRLFTAKLAGFVLNHIGVPAVSEGTALNSAPWFRRSAYHQSRGHQYAASLS